MQTREEKAASRQRWKEANREKVRACNAAWAAANPEKDAAAKRKWKTLNPEKRAAWEAANPEKLRGYSNAWAKRNPVKKLELKRRRDAALLQRVPAWADHEKIAEFYKIRNAAIELFEQPFEVDHIIPLRGKRVSGLHVHTNLQVLPQSKNRKKHNCFEVEFQQETRDLATAA